jgi:hypothetical protein
VCFALYSSSSLSKDTSVFAVYSCVCVYMYMYMPGRVERCLKKVSQNPTRLGQFSTG